MSTPDCKHDWQFVQGLTERLRCTRCGLMTWPKSPEERAQDMLTDIATIGSSWSRGGERINPLTVYKDEPVKTLDDHNRDAYARMQGHEPRPKAHVACPKCHSEMEYEDPHMVLASYPPKRVVICPGCGHRDYKVEA